MYFKVFVVQSEVTFDHHVHVGLLDYQTHVKYLNTIKGNRVCEVRRRSAHTVEMPRKKKISVSIPLCFVFQPYGQGRTLVTFIWTIFL